MRRWSRPSAAKARRSRLWRTAGLGRRRMQARLGPQLENLAQELATEIKPFLEQRPSVIRVHASHGFAVAKLREFLDREPGIGVDLRYVSNQHSLVALAQGACDLSGLHLPHGALRAQGIKASARLAGSARGSHHQFRHARDGADGRARQSAAYFLASGSHRSKSPLRQPRPSIPARACCSTSCLPPNGIDESKINGAQQIEFTHAAVAAYVASGMADASFGVEAAARHFGLDFIRILTEDYFFVCKRAFLDTGPMQRIPGDHAQRRDFRAAVATLPGYVPSDTGNVTGVKAFLESVGVERRLKFCRRAAVQTSVSASTSGASRGDMVAAAFRRQVEVFDR